MKSRRGWLPEYNVDEEVASARPIHSWVLRSYYWGVGAAQWLHPVGPRDYRVRFFAEDFGAVRENRYERQARIAAVRARRKAARARGEVEQGVGEERERKRQPREALFLERAGVGRWSVLNGAVTVERPVEAEIMSKVRLRPNRDYHVRSFFGIAVSMLTMHTMLRRMFKRPVMRGTGWMLRGLVGGVAVLACMPFMFGACEYLAFRPGVQRVYEEMLHYQTLQRMDVRERARVRGRGAAASLLDQPDRW